MLVIFGSISERCTFHGESGGRKRQFSKGKSINSRAPFLCKGTHLGWVSGSQGNTVGIPDSDYYPYPGYSPHSHPHLDAWLLGVTVHSLWWAAPGPPEETTQRHTFRTERRIFLFLISKSGLSPSSSTCTAMKGRADGLKLTQPHCFGFNCHEDRQSSYTPRLNTILEKQTQFKPMAQVNVLKIGLLVN